MPGRRKSDEFALSVSEAALLHMAHREPGYLPKVKEVAYELIYDSERWLCGHIAQPFAISGVNLSRWWRAFEVEGLWFVLKPRDPPPFSKVREYELLPAFGPTPDDELPPTLHRLQTSPSPDYIGPRRRRNRGDQSGARTTAKPPQVKGKKRNDVKRVFTLLYNLALEELELLSQNVAYSVEQSWRCGRPRLLRGLALIRRLDRACGNLLHDLRVTLASVVQALPTTQVFSRATHKNLTRERERAPEAFSASGSLEVSDAGHTIIPRLKLNSWIWDEPPLPWADDLFGVLWPPNLFGALEEEVFT